jgi:hypothetical protein
MERMHKIITLLFITALFCLKTQAQNIGPYSEVSFTAGTTYYLGDLNDVHFGLAQPAASFNFKRNFDGRIAFKVGVLIGELRGNDKENLVDTAKINRNLHFKSPIYELSGVFEYNFLPYESGNYNYPFTPFVFAGIGIFQFNPSARQFDTDNVYDNDLNNSNNPFIELQPLGTEGQFSSNYPERTPYQLTQISIPLGVGFKVSLGRKFSMSAEYGIRKTFTDYIDDVGGTYADPAYLFSNNVDAAYLSDRTLALQEFLGTNPSLERINDWHENAGTQRANANDWSDWYTFTGISIIFKINQNKACF